MVLIIVIIFIIPEDRRQHPGLLKAKVLKLQDVLCIIEIYTVSESLGLWVLLHKHAQILCHTSQDDKMWLFTNKNELESKITEQDWEQDYITG